MDAADETGSRRHATERCASAREALSARFDGEAAELHPDAVADHLGDCSACRTFEARLAGLSERTRLAGAVASPDLTATILAALGEQEVVAERQRGAELRWLVALAGAVQLALAVPSLIGWVGADVHTGRDLGSLQLALGVGLILAAWQPQRASGVLPIAAVVVAVTLVAVGIDVTRTTTTLLAELGHLAEVVGVVALWALRRQVPEGPRLPRIPVPSSV